MLCKDIKHQLYKCPDFMKKSLEDRRTYIKDNKLCYGCTKAGHSAKECRRRHNCDTCKGRHPTCLHDNNYVKRPKGDKPAQKERAKPVQKDSATQQDAEDIASALSFKTTKEGQSASTSMIVPVWVSSVKNPNTRVI